MNDASKPSASLLRRGLMLGVPALAVAGLAATQLGRPAPAQPAPPPPAVTVATPLQREVTSWDEFIGRFAPSTSVEVRPRISGAVTAVHFQDGQMVREGDLLFTIDPRPFEAALAEARAHVAAANSALELARVNLSRGSRLVSSEAVAPAQIDALRSRARSAEAELAAAQARLDARALDVEFTRIRAPISGRISDRRVNPGNLVAGGSGPAATLLTTINALDPIYFVFDASEALYLKAQRERGMNQGAVEIRLQDESGYRWSGTLDFTDNGLDTRSGTIRGRATLANPELFLTPGLFGHMRLAGGSATSLLIPETAIQSDQAGRAVLVVGEDGKVTLRPVELGPRMAGGLRVITRGLAATDRVVIGGQVQASPGAQVQARAGEITARAETARGPGLPPSAQATLSSSTN